MKVAVQPASQNNREVLRHLEDTIMSPVELQAYADLFGPDLEVLKKAFPSGQAPLWGVAPGRRNVNVGKYHKVGVGDFVFFYGEKRLYLGGYVAHTFRNPALAETLWTLNENGQTWEFMYALTALRDFDVPIEEVRERIGFGSNFHFQNFYVLEDEKADRIVELCNLDDSHQAPGRGHLSRGSAPTRPRISGETDGLSVRGYRKEQKDLRAWLITTGGGICALCGREFPEEFHVAAHIKKRSECTEEERLDLQNVAMLACAFGCDPLFEKGYVAVGSDGEILISPFAQRFPQVQQYIDVYLRGRTVPVHSDTSEPYFRWHRSHTFQASIGQLHVKG